MNVFATGTSGLIGSKIIGAVPVHFDLLKQKEYPDISFDSNSTLIHLAGIVGESKVQANKELARRVNVDGTVNLAKFILRTSKSRFVFVSSSHIYRPSCRPLKEEDVLEPISLYGKLKLETETRLAEVFAGEPDRLCIVRVFSVLDTGMPKGTLGWAIEKLSANHPLENCDDQRDFQTTSEIATLLLRIARTSAVNGIVNLCSGESKTVRKACVDLRNQLGLKTDLDLLKSGNSSTPIIVGDRSRLRSVLPADLVN